MRHRECRLRSCPCWQVLKASPRPRECRRFRFPRRSRQTLRPFRPPRLPSPRRWRPARFSRPRGHPGQASAFRGLAPFGRRTRPIRARSSPGRSPTRALCPAQPPGQRSCPGDHQLPSHLRRTLPGVRHTTEALIVSFSSYLLAGRPWRGTDCLLYHSRSSRGR